MPMGLNSVGDFMHKPTVRVDIRVGPGGVELVDLEVPEGRRDEAYAWLGRALPALQSLDQAVSAASGGYDGRS